jgi:hypothetical protein
MSNPTNKEVVVAIFASRDSVRTVMATLQAVEESSRGLHPRIEIIVNGSPSLARGLSEALTARAHDAQAFASLRVWSIVVADKANAWNQCIDKLLPAHFSGTLVCVDGNVRPTPGAISTLANYFDTPGATLAACGTAQNGASVIHDYASGTLQFGLRGNLFALSGSCIEQFRHIQFTLPLGIYRNDGLIGAVLVFGLNIKPRVWDESRLKIFPKIGWVTEPVASRIVNGVFGYVDRSVRQAQGRFENAAIHNLLNVQSAPMHSVSKPIASLVADWIRAHPLHAVRLFTSHPFSPFGLWRLFSRQRKWAKHTSFEPFLPSLKWDSELGYGRRASDQLAARVPPVHRAGDFFSALTSSTASGR